MSRPRKAVHERLDREVARRYELGKRIGRGCYGVVYQVRETNAKGSPSYAIKKVLDAFRNPWDAQRTYREVAYLLELGHHANILAVRDILCSGNDRHLYLVCELLDSDLQKALRCQSLKPVHRQYVAYQLLCALKYVHSAGIMHRDLKPSNVLLDSSCRAVLADFGWARSVPASSGEDGPLTSYAASRWYRSPEMLLGSRHYGTAVDMWSVGCVVGEMHRLKPLIPGTSTIDMLGIIYEMLGKPLSTDIAGMEAPHAGYALTYLPGGPPNQPLDELLPKEPLVVLDFLKLLLQYNPSKRLTAEEALEHPYVGPFHDPDNEPSFGRRVNLRLPDGERFPCSQYRDQIYAEIIGLRASQERLSMQRKRGAEQQRLVDPEYGRP